MCNARFGAVSVQRPAESRQPHVPLCSRTSRCQHPPAPSWGAGCRRRSASGCTCSTRSCGRGGGTESKSEWQESRRLAGRLPAGQSGMCAQLRQAGSVPMASQRHGQPTAENFSDSRQPHPVCTRLKYLGRRGRYLSCHQYTCGRQEHVQTIRPAGFECGRASPGRHAGRAGRLLASSSCRQPSQPATCIPPAAATPSVALLAYLLQAQARLLLVLTQPTHPTPHLRSTHLGLRVQLHLPSKRRIAAGPQISHELVGGLEEGSLSRFLLAGGGAARGADAGDGWRAAGVQEAARFCGMAEDGWVRVRRGGGARQGIGPIRLRATCRADSSDVQHPPPGCARMRQGSSPPLPVPLPTPTNLTTSLQHSARKKGQTPTSGARHDAAEDAVGLRLRWARCGLGRADLSVPLRLLVLDLRSRVPRSEDDRVFQHT